MSRAMSNCPERSVVKTRNHVAVQTVVTTYSQLLALEPRLVFDASTAAVFDVADEVKNSPDNNGGHGAKDASSVTPTVDAQSGEQAASQNPELAAEKEAENILRSFASLSDELESADDGPKEGIMATSSAGAPWTEPPDLTFSDADEAFTVKEDGTLHLGLAGLITLTEGGRTDFTITIAVENGTLSLDLIPGAQDTTYRWSEDLKTVTFSGDIDFCRDVLATLRYTGGKYWHGIDTLTITIEDGIDADGYNSGERAVKATQDITVLSVPNAPEFKDLPPSNNHVGSHDGADNGVWEDIPATLRFNYGTPEAPVWRSLSIFDPDNSYADLSFNDRYDLTIVITNGTLSSSYGGKTLLLLTDTLHDPAGQRSYTERTYTLDGLTLDEVNGILANLQFLGDQDYFGPAALTIIVKDLGDADDPAPPENPILTQTFTIDVLAVNDAPTLKPAERDDTDKQLRVTEGGDGILTLAMFHMDYGTDPKLDEPDFDGFTRRFDVDNTLVQLMVTIDSAPEDGDLWRYIGGSTAGGVYADGVWVKLAQGSTFSLQDVADGRIKYEHSGKQVREDSAGEQFVGSTHDSFTFHINDGANAENSIVREDIHGNRLAIHFVIDPVNQPPTVVVERIPGLIDRLDTTIVHNPETGQNVSVHTIWGYEGEQGIPFAFNVMDPDQAEGADFIIRFIDLSGTVGWGFFWYKASDDGPYVKVTAGMEISLDRVQAGFLRFSHSGANDKIGAMNFKISVTDDGGGEGRPLTVSAELAINFRPNNDHPEWHEDVKVLWDNEDNFHKMDTGSGYLVPITNKTLNLSDSDSDDLNLTYTVHYNPSEGQLLFHVGHDSYRLHQPGDKISQADINSGNVVWRFYGTSDVDPETGQPIPRPRVVELTFTVRDGSLTATPAPPDREQPADGIPWSDNPADMPASSTGWENANRLTSHEGGIGKWVEGADGVYRWQLTVFTLHISSIIEGEGPGIFPMPVPDPTPHFTPHGPGVLYEGGMINITDEMFEAWFTNDRDNDATIDPDDPSGLGSPSKLVYRIEGFTQHGWILYQNTNESFTYLGQFSSFTQQDIIDGRIFYLHNSSESLNDSFTFSVSDGRKEAINTKPGPEYGTKNFTFVFEMTAVNDTPETGEGAVVRVRAHDLEDGESANHKTPGGIAHITTEHIVASDVDGSGGKRGYYSEPNNLYIVITQLPEAGTLFYNRVKITADMTPDQALLDRIANSGGFKTWFLGDDGLHYLNEADRDSKTNGFMAIAYADLAHREDGSVTSKLIYQHGACNVFYTDFHFIVSDDRGIDPGMVKDRNGLLLDRNGLLLDPNNPAHTKIHDGQSVNSREQIVNIAIIPVNDMPESRHMFDTPGDPRHLPRDNVRVDEGGEVQLNLNGNNINYIDPDGSPEAIQFILHTLPEYGQLFLGDKALGEGSVFTQADIDARRVRYVHDGSENHRDAFAFHVSDSIYTSGLGVHRNDPPDTIHIDVRPINKAPEIHIDGPPELYVESVEGGLMFDIITVLDPDFGRFMDGGHEADGYPGTGIVNDHMTAIITLAVDWSAPSNPLDLDKVILRFGNQEALISFDRDGNTITLVGSYAQIRYALSKVTVLSGEDGRYEQTGIVLMTLTVYDGIQNEHKEWVDSNGEVGGKVLDDEVGITLYISPLNTPPRIVNDYDKMELTYTEEHRGRNGGWVAILDASEPLGQPIKITDIDAFQRGSNSITLTVGNGILTATPARGAIIDGRGTDTLIITGTLDQINATLATLQYRPDAGYNNIGKDNTIEPDILKFTYRDNANSGDMPEEFNNTDKDSGYNIPYKYETNRGKWGFAVNGEFHIIVEPVNTRPTVDAPTEVFFKGDSSFNGFDGRGDVPIAITVDDLDVSRPGQERGRYQDDRINVTLTLSGPGAGSPGGWLSFDYEELDDLGVSINDGTGSDGKYTQVTLSGTLEAVNAALTAMEYQRTSWAGSNVDYLHIIANDATPATPATPNGASNGSPKEGSALNSDPRIITIYCSDKNYPPEVDLPDKIPSSEDGWPDYNWKVMEDDPAAKIFTDLVITDPDSFDKQVFVTISVKVGTLDIDRSDISGGPNGFTFGGNPALQDRYHVSSDGKTISFYASLDKINAAIKQITYEAPLDYNGFDKVTIEVNDLGMWGDRDGQTYYPVPGNSWGISGEGLRTIETGTIRITAVNDAPVAQAPETVIQAPPIGEDVPSANNNGQTVSSLFGDRFDDSKDNQYKNGANPHGSPANTLAGVLIKSLPTDPEAAKGAWQYSADGGATWTNLGVGMFVKYTDSIRFNPATDYNGTVAGLSVYLVENSNVFAYPDVHQSGTPVARGVHSDDGPFSKDSLNVTIKVTAVNDAPIARNPETPVIATPILEDASSAANNGQTVNSLFGGRFDDSKDEQYRSGTNTDGSRANTLAGVVIKSLPTGPEAAKGAWQYRGADGIWRDLAVGMFVKNTDGIRFNPAEDYNGAVTGLSVYLVESSGAFAAGAAPNSGVPVTYAYSDSGPFSKDSLDVTITVTAVNDAPVALNPGTPVEMPSIDEDTPSAANNGQTVNSLFGGRFDDSRDDQYKDGANPTGSKANDFSGVLVVGNTANSAMQGTWQYHDGTGWKDIPVLAAGEVFALEAGWSVRFNPAPDFNGNPPALEVRLIDSSVNAPDNPATSNPAPTWGVKQTFTAAMWTAINTDNGITRYSRDSIFLRIFVKPVNDAPIASDIPRVFTEDTTYTGTVNSLFGSAFNDDRDDKQAVGGPNASKADPFEGVFITGNEATAEQGRWQYHNGVGWQDIPTSGLSDTNAFYLHKDTQIRFVPHPDYNGEVGSLSFRVMEHHANAGGYTSGAAGHDLTGKMGGENHISGDRAAVLTLSVTAVNDAPIALTPETPVIATPILEDASSAANNGQTVNSLFGGRFDDSKDQQYHAANNPTGSQANTLAGVVIKSLPTGPEAAKGAWQYRGADGIWRDLAVGMFVKNTDDIRFNPAEDYNGAVTGLSAYLVENSGAFANAADHQSGRTVVYAYTDDGPFSKNSLDVTIEVKAVNDAPVALNPERPVVVDSIYENTPSEANPGQRVYDLFGSRFDDNKDQQFHETYNPDGSKSDSLAGVLIASLPSEAEKGAWQYSADNGVTWENLVVGMFVEKDALIRFDPAFNQKGPVTGLSVHLVETGDFADTSISGRILANHNAHITPSGPFSEVSLDVTITVAATNNAPQASGTETRLDNIKEDPGYANNDAADIGGETVSILFEKHFVDSNDDDFAGVLVVGNSANSATQGAWQYHDGSGWRNIPVLGANEVFALKADWSVRFNPAPDFNGNPPPLETRLIDSSVNTPTNTVATNPLPSWGVRQTFNRAMWDAIDKDNGVARYSKDSVFLRISVEAVNDAPVALNPGTPVQANPIDMDADPDLNDGQTVYDLFNHRFNDSKDQQFHAVNNPAGSQANTLAGVVIRGLPTDAEADKGVWQYRDHNGDWHDLAVGMFVKHTDSIRFYSAPDYNGSTVTGLSVALVESSGAFTAPDAHQSGYMVADAYSDDGPFSLASLSVIIAMKPNSAPQDVTTDANNAPQDVTTGVNTESQPSPHIEGAKDYPDTRAILKALEEDKPVVLNVRNAQGSLSYSLDRGVSDVLGFSRGMGAYYPEGSDRHGLNLLNTSMGPTMLLAGRPAEAVLENGRDNEFRLPATLFLYTDALGKLTLTATMTNGEPLPSWLIFDASSMTFRGMPPEGETGMLELVVTAKSASGREVAVNVTLHLNNPEDAGQTENSADVGQERGEDNEESRNETEGYGMSGLSDQIGNHGQAGILKTTQRLLQNLKLL